MGARCSAHTHLSGGHEQESLCFQGLCVRNVESRRVKAELSLQLLSVLVDKPSEGAFSFFEERRGYREAFCFPST